MDNRRVCLMATSYATRTSEGKREEERARKEKEQQL